MPAGPESRQRQVRGQLGPGEPDLPPVAVHVARTGAPSRAIPTRATTSRAMAAHSASVRRRSPSAVRIEHCQTGRSTASTNCRGSDSRPASAATSVAAASVLVSVRARPGRRGRHRPRSRPGGGWCAQIGPHRSTRRWEGSPASAAALAPRRVGGPTEWCMQGERPVLDGEVGDVEGRGLRRLDARRGDPDRDPPGVDQLS